MLKQQSIQTEEVIVTGNKPMLDHTSSEYGANLRLADFEYFPLDRNYKSIVSLLPHANTSYFGDEVNFAGATGFENRYFIDGVDVTEGLSGATGTSLPYNFINEIEVKTGGYEAEYKSSLGGIINVITKSGSNEFHGSAFGFYTSNHLTYHKSLGLLDPSQGGFASYDAGIAFGGAIIRNSLWYYTAYNPAFYNREVEIPGAGIYFDKSIKHSFAGKLTWRTTDNLQFVLSSSGDPSFRNAVEGGAISVINPDPYLITQKTGGINFSLSSTYYAKDFLLEAFTAVVTSQYKLEPATEKGKNEILFNNSGVWSGGPSANLNWITNQLMFRMNFTYLVNTHKLKAGIEYKDNKFDQFATNHYVWKYDDTTFYEWNFKSNGIVHNRIPSVFVQDHWSFNEWLNIYFGMRWDGQYIIGSDNRVDQKILKPIQPRFGFIILPFKNGSGKLFGSFGRFIQELSTTVPALYYDEGTVLAYVLFNHDPRFDSSAGKTLQYHQGRIDPEDKNMSAQYFDEFSLGYQHLFNSGISVSIHGVFRKLREAIEGVWYEPEKRFRVGNPGSGILYEFPKARRDYTAISITLEGNTSPYHFLRSYVLSRNYGNYSGLFDFKEWPNDNDTFNYPDNIRQYGAGLLLNNRTHVFKFAGSYNFYFGLTVGLSFIFQSGTPLSKYSSGSELIAHRGTAGNSPALWDLNVRFTYNLSNMFESYHFRLILDLFHIASQQQPVQIEQMQYFEVNNGIPANPNPLYGKVLRYQPSMSIRFGLE